MPSTTQGDGGPEAGQGLSPPAAAVGQLTKARLVGATLELHSSGAGLDQEMSHQLVGQVPWDGEKEVGHCSGSPHRLPWLLYPFPSARRPGGTEGRRDQEAGAWGRRDHHWPPGSTTTCSLLSDATLRSPRRAPSEELWETQVLPSTPGSEETVRITQSLEEGVTFLVLLHDGRRGRRHLHGQPVGPPEGVAVTDDEGPWLLILQECDG